MRLLEDILVFTIVASAAAYLIFVFGPKPKKNSNCGSACPKCSSDVTSMSPQASFGGASSSR